MIRLAILIAITAIALLLCSDSSAISHHWAMCGCYLQSKWDTFTSLTGTDAHSHYVNHIFLFSNFLFFTIGGIFAIMDLTQRPKFLRKYKTLPNANEPLDLSKFLHILPLVIFNQIVLNYLFFQGVFQLKVYLSLTFPDITVLPSVTTVMIHLVILGAVREIFLFYGHWLLHHRLIYRHFHKTHHEWVTPVALAASYQHPVEYIVMGLLPVSLGPLLMDVHILTQYLGSLVSMTVTLINHSGYHLPLLPSPEYHEFHHRVFSENYGSKDSGLDRLHGTDCLFRRSAACKRDMVLFTTKSAWELFPDEDEDEIDDESKLK